MYHRDKECDVLTRWTCGLFFAFVAAWIILGLAACGDDPPKASTAIPSPLPSLATPTSEPSPTPPASPTISAPTPSPTSAATSTAPATVTPSATPTASPTPSSSAEATPTPETLRCADLAGARLDGRAVIVSFAPGFDCDARVGVHYRWQVGVFPDGDPAYAQGGVECPYDPYAGEYRALLPEEATHWRFEVTALDGSIYDSPWYSVGVVS